MQPIDLKKETEGSRERAGTRRRKERGEMNVSRADLAPSPIRQSSKSGQQPQLIWTAQLVLVLLVLLISSSNVGVSAQKSENKNDAPQIATNIDPEPVDGATDEEYSGQWEEAKARPIDHRKPPMEFIRKFSWEKQLMGANMEQRKGKPSSQTENEQYDEVLAARILAQEDVDRLSPAEGGDRIASNIGDQNDDYGNYYSTQKSIIKPASHLNNVYSSSSPSSISPFPSTTRSYTKIPSNLPSKLPNFPPGKISKQSEGTVALSELDLKSDGELAKIMQRTTLKTREYPIERTRPIITTTPFPLLATPVPPFPGFLFPQPIHSAPQNVPQNPRQNRHHQRPEQFEKLGCEFDFMSQSCKDVFRIGWCQNCIDFGNNPFFHDCRCTAVTGLYVQTATFLGSSAASARANAALTAVASNQTSSSSHSYSNGGFGPFLAPLPLLPSLDQLAAPLVEITGPPSTSPPNFLAQTVTPGQVVQALADALRLPQTAMPLLNPISSSNSAAQFQPQSPSNIPLAIPPLLGPPARAFGTSQFLPQNGAPIVPQFVSQGGNGKRK